ncbi:MAG: autotransporter outer membrane beta-barrel domain-containing protein [Parvibaculum sp.]|nr:autotransporter outer membrane beta-barrel domain-containing protein [Parvibaculum sp.]
MTEMLKTILKIGAGVVSVSLLAGTVAVALPPPPHGVDEFTPTQDAIGSKLQDVQQQQRDQTLRAYFDRLNLRRSGRGAMSTSDIGMTGLSAGDAALTEALSAWLAVSYNNAENDFPGIAYDADTYGVSVGLDYKLSDTVNVGAFLSYSNIDTTTPFNGGGSDTDSYSVGPYVSVALSDIFSVDATVGYTVSKIDNRRVFFGLPITGEQDASTWFGAVNLSATKWLDNNVGLTGRVGYSYSHSQNDAYVDSTATPVAKTESDLGQLQVAGRVSYYTGTMMPYVGLTYVHDVERERIIAAPLPSDDRDEFIANAGLSFFGEGPISGGVDVSYNFSRDDTEGFGIGANISFKF